jgi:hypothetical protein
VVCQFEAADFTAYFDGAATGTVTGTGFSSSISSGVSLARAGIMQTGIRTYTLTVTNVSGTVTSTCTIETIICENEW